MKELKCKDIARMAKGEIIGGDENAVVNNVVIDSRKAAAGSLFVALKGENHDAHAFLEGACAGGAAALLISNRAEGEKLLRAGADTASAAPSGPHRLPCVILVPDTQRALADLAAAYIKTFENLKVVGVTGSTGKTSTKDMLHAVLSEKYKTAKTMGNFNNELGLPLTVLGLEEGTEAVVLEMGMSAFGEIHYLVDIAKPDVGIITNVGISHIENLGSRENILKAKLEITDYFNENNLLIIYDDGDVLCRQSAEGNYRLKTVGNSGYSDLIISDVEDRGADGLSYSLEVDEKIYHIKLPVAGVHNAMNASLAIAAGIELGVSPEQAAEGLAKLTLTDKRLSVKAADGIKVIDDTYNASPDSMKAGIGVLVHTAGIRKVAILGDMFELGEDSLRYHREVGEFAGRQKIDMVIAIGENAKAIAEGALENMPKERVLHFNSKKDFIMEIGDIITKGDVVLVKGSRGMAMEEIVEKILKGE